MDWLLVAGCFVCAPVVAWVTERARKSGRIRARYGEILRSESPRTFQTVLIVGWAMSALCVVIGLAGAAVLVFVPTPK